MWPVEPTELGKWLNFYILRSATCRENRILRNLYFIILCFTFLLLGGNFSVMLGKLHKRCVGGDFCFPLPHIAWAMESKDKLYFSFLCSLYLNFYHLKACKINLQKYLTRFCEHTSKSSAPQHLQVFAACLHSSLTITWLLQDSSTAVAVSLWQWIRNLFIF